MQCTSPYYVSQHGQLIESKQYSDSPVFGDNIFLCLVVEERKEEDPPACHSSRTENPSETAEQAPSSYIQPVHLTCNERANPLREGLRNTDQVCFKRRPRGVWRKFQNYLPLDVKFIFTDISFTKLFRAVGLMINLTLYVSNYFIGALNILANIIVKNNNLSYSKK